MQQSGERVFEAELHRLRGLIALEIGDREAAERALTRALDIAEAQGARLFELRAATAVAECCGRDRPGTRERLGRAYRSFAEGFDRPDLQRARAALGQARSQVTRGRGDDSV